MPRTRKRPLPAAPRGGRAAPAPAIPAPAAAAPAPAAARPADEIPTFDFGILRVLRQKASLTLEDVSARSGVSIAVLSKLERNRTKAELDTLFRVARVFGLSALDLLALAEAPLSQRHHSIEYASDGFRFQRLSYANLGLFLGEAKAGAHVRRPEIHRDVHETCWVLAGRIRLVLPHESVELAAGESVQFDGVQEHTYEALADTRLLIAHVKKANRY